jgi:hypothetical protein
MMSSERLGSGSETGSHGGQQRDTGRVDRCISQYATPLPNDRAVPNSTIRPQDAGRPIRTFSGSALPKHYRSINSTEPFAI